MNIKEITEGIFYVGVNDRVTEKFEGLWPIPHGVSYNSYIVKGTEATALIDTVRIDEVREFFNNIELIQGDRKVDYLVVNHMEPDHSGSIPEVLLAHPEIKIVGNAQTIGMIKGFYKVEDDSRFLEVKHGDTLSLGGKTLKFYITPMVHWPETMMTYVEENATLFSGDAFGTFGALNGAVTDREMDTDRYIPEMYRYYSNIVGKYGKFVQGALAKLSGVKIDRICSTHGPVWESRVEEVVGIVDRLSRYESEPGLVIIYGSMYGNTAEMAEVIARGAAEAGVKNIIIHNASHSSLSDMISDAYRYEGLAVGCATYSMTLFPPVEAFMQAMETREIKNKVFAAFGSFTWAKGVVGSKMEEYANRIKLEPVGYVVMKQTLDAETHEAALNLGREIGSRLKK